MHLRRDGRRWRLLVGVGLTGASVATALAGGVPAGAVACGGFFDANGDGYEDVPVGVPNEDVAGAANAGSVTILMGTAAGQLTGSGARHVVQSQVGDVSENSDRFGATVAVIDWNPIVDQCPDLAIGIPGENGSRGKVIVVLGSANGLALGQRVALAQGANGAADTAEPGDRFGESMMASGVSPAGTAAALVVGAPGEDVGAAVDAGIVTAFRFGSNGVISRAGVTRAPRCRRHPRSTRARRRLRHLDGFGRRAGQPGVGDRRAR